MLPGIFWKNRIGGGMTTLCIGRRIADWAQSYLAIAPVHLRSSVGCFLTIGLLSGGLAAMSSHSAEVSLRSLLQSSLQAHEEAESYEEFLDSKFSTEAVRTWLLNHHAILQPREVCSSFDELQPEDLSVFTPVLESSILRIHYPCLVGQTRALERWMTTQQLDLLQDTQPFGQSRIETFQATEPLGPSEDRYLNAKNGGLSLPEDQRLKSGELALTFDDGPHPRRTPRLLDILAQEQVRATFFVVGRAARAYPQILQRIWDEGHTVAGHTYSHPNLARRSFQTAVDEINAGFDVIIESIGVVDPFFRFPYGARTRRLRNYLQQKDIHDFFWDIDTLDWKKKNPQVLLRYALQQTNRAGRGIVLFHDIQPQTIAMMPAYLEELKKRDYKIIAYRSGEAPEQPQASPGAVGEIY